MNPDKQRIAIASAGGIQDARWGADGLLKQKMRGWVGPDNNTGKLIDVPDYLNDLNAIHESEKTLTAKQADAYCAMLDEIVSSTVRDGKPPWSEYRYVCATAAQRAEAFLRTIGKWEDSA